MDPFPRAFRESMEYVRPVAHDDFAPIARAVYRCARDKADFLTPPPCDFAEARRVLSQTPDIKSVDPGGFLLKAIERIEAEPAEFLPHDALGFRFQRWGMDLFELKREDGENSQTQGAWGTLVWQRVIRKEAQLRRLEEHNASRFQRWFRSFWFLSPNGTKSKDV